MNDAGRGDLHQHAEPQDREQHQGGNVEGKAAVQRIGPRGAQRRATAAAARVHLRAEGRHDLEQPTAGAFAKLGRRYRTVGRGRHRSRARHLGLQERRDSVGELAHGVADGRHLARHVRRGRLA